MSARGWCGLVVLVLPLAGVAQEPDAEGPRSAAVRLGSEGAAAYKDGRYADALSQFDAAYRTYPAPALLLNLSRTELKLERCEEPLRYAHLYLSTGNSRDVAFAESPVSWLAYVDSQCPDVEIRTEPDRAVIEIAGAPLAEQAVTPWRGRLFARPHAIALRHQGFHDNHDTLNIQNGAAQTFSFTLNPDGGAPRRRALTPDPVPLVVAPEAAVPPPPVVEMHKPRPDWTLSGPTTPKARGAFDVAIGFTAAATVVGIVGGATALAAGSGLAGADASGFTAAQPVIQARATTANVGFALAGAGLITSIVFWLKGESIFPEPFIRAHDP